MDKEVIVFITEITVIVFVVMNTLIQIVTKQIKKGKEKENKTENVNTIKMIHVGLEKTLAAISDLKEEKFEQQVKQIREKADLLANQLFIIYCNALNLSVQDGKALRYKKLCLLLARDKAVEILIKKAKDNNFERYSDDAWSRYVNNSVEYVIEKAGQVQVDNFDEDIMGATFKEASEKTTKEYLLNSKLVLMDLFSILRDNAEYYAEEINKLKAVLNKTKDVQIKII